MWQGSRPPCVTDVASRLSIATIETNADALDFLQCILCLSCIPFPAAFASCADVYLRKWYRASSRTNMTAFELDHIDINSWRIAWMGHRRSRHESCCCCSRKGPPQVVPPEGTREVRSVLSFYLPGILCCTKVPLVLQTRIKCLASTYFKGNFWTFGQLSVWRSNIHNSPIKGHQPSSASSSESAHSYLL